MSQLSRMHGVKINLPVRDRFGLVATEWHFPPGAHGPQNVPGALFFVGQMLAPASDTRRHPPPANCSARPLKNFFNPIAPAGATAVAPAACVHKRVQSAARRDRQSVCRRSAARPPARPPLSTNHSKP